MTTLGGGRGGASFRQPNSVSSMAVREETVSVFNRDRDPAWDNESHLEVMATQM